MAAPNGTGRLSNTDAEPDTVTQLLDDSLCCGPGLAPGLRESLLRHGIDAVTASVRLAEHRSEKLYGYTLRPRTGPHIVSLIQRNGVSLLLDSPAFLCKACWLYEHAPAFLPCPPDGVLTACDEAVLSFAQGYAEDVILREPDLPALASCCDPSRRRPVRWTTFWERETLDPLRLVSLACAAGFEGVELCVDFHPFNPLKLLPEEIDSRTRAALRELCDATGMVLDIHAPIVGPYRPEPSPAEGRQSFFDPSACRALHHATLALARDIGAQSLVIHLIDEASVEVFAELVRAAEGSSVRITVENYCQTSYRQDSTAFLAQMERLLSLLPNAGLRRHLGITLDVGHLNIEGEDPLVGAVRIGRWCREQGLFLRVHATNNYGLLLFSPPSFSADVHFNVSGKGINNSLIIKALRSIGADVGVVAEQISPLSEEDFTVLEQALTAELPGTFDAVAAVGRERLAGAVTGGLIDEAAAAQPAYQFAAGLLGVNGLREYLVYRIIQSKKHLSVEDAARISREYTCMPQSLKSELTVYMDDLLLPLQMESGALQKSQLDLICQNIDSNLFRAMDADELRQVFSAVRSYSRGEVICRQGDAGSGMFILREGRARVCIDNDRVATLGPGEIFGEISLFYHIPRSAAVIAETTPTVIGILTREGFEALLTSDEVSMRALIGRLYRALPVRLRNMNERYKLAIRSLRLLSSGDRGCGLPSADAAGDIGERFPRHENVPALLSEEALIVYERIIEFEGNEVVFSEGDPADGLYVILEGEAEVLAMEEAPPIVLGFLGEGDVFGELAVMGNSVRSATVRTLRYTRAAFMSLDRFTRFMDSGSELSFRFMGLLCLLLFRRIVHLDRAYSDAKGSLRDAAAAAVAAEPAAHGSA